MQIESLRNQTTSKMKQVEKIWTELSTLKQVELSVADDANDFFKSISFDTGYINQALKIVQAGTSEAENTLKSITEMEGKLKDFQAQVKQLGIDEEAKKAANAMRNLKQMKTAFRDMSKNGKAAIAALKSI